MNTIKKTRNLLLVFTSLLILIFTPNISAYDLSNLEDIGLEPFEEINYDLDEPIGLEVMVQLIMESDLSDVADTYFLTNEDRSSAAYVLVIKEDLSYIMPMIKLGEPSAVGAWDSVYDFFMVTSETTSMISDYNNSDYADNYYVIFVNPYMDDYVMIMSSDNEVLYNAADGTNLTYEANPLDYIR